MKEERWDSKTRCSRMNESTNESINESTNESIKESTNESINEILRANNNPKKVWGKKETINQGITIIHFHFLWNSFFFFLFSHSRIINSHLLFHSSLSLTFNHTKIMTNRELRKRRERKRRRKIPIQTSSHLKWIGIDDQSKDEEKVRKKKRYQNLREKREKKKLRKKRERKRSKERKKGESEVAMNRQIEWQHEWKLHVIKDYTSLSFLLLNFFSSFHSLSLSFLSFFLSFLSFSFVLNVKERVFNQEEIWKKLSSLSFSSFLFLFASRIKSFTDFFGWKKESGRILTGSKRKMRGKKERRRKIWKPINVSKRTRYIFNQGVNQVIKREENEWKEKEGREIERRKNGKRKKKGERTEFFE